MHRRAFVPLGVVLVGGAAANLHAGVVSMSITADNHYAIYNTVSAMGGPLGLQFIGMNEVGSAGDPGEYNWSLPEQWEFENTTGVLYIAAWSDDSYAQGLLAQLALDQMALHSGHSAWSVYPTGLDLDDFDVRPTEAQMAGYIQTATAGDLWEAPYVGGFNGVAPWNMIPGVTTDARWMWWNRPGDENPLDGGTGDGEFIIFRLGTETIPSPGALPAVIAGVAAGLRRRRD